MRYHSTPDRRVLIPPFILSEMTLKRRATTKHMDIASVPGYGQWALTTREIGLYGRSQDFRTFGSGAGA